MPIYVTIHRADFSRAERLEILPTDLGLRWHADVGPRNTYNTTQYAPRDYPRSEQVAIWRRMPQVLLRNILMEHIRVNEAALHREHLAEHKKLATPPTPTPKRQD